MVKYNCHKTILQTRTPAEVHLRRILSPAWLLIIALVILAAGLIFLNPNLRPGAANPQEAAFPGITLALTAEAKESLQVTGDAFPAEAAGFSAYYRRGSPGSYSLNKGKVDAHVFGPRLPDSTPLRAGPAGVIEMGDNYTIAKLTLDNIDDLPSDVNLYYDTEGWIVAYLPTNAPSSQIWQAREIDEENPRFTTINHTLLDAINVVIDEALSETAVTYAQLNYYHWQHEDANQFLMLASSQATQGTYPIAFTIPTAFDVAEVSATMWVAQGSNTTAPCAIMALDAETLVSKCAKGLYHKTVDLYQLGKNPAHNFTLTQSDSNQGASGALLMVVYAKPTSSS